MSEILAVADENDNLIGSASWEKVFEKKLIHRASNVIVFNSKGQIYVHKRADGLNLFPGLYDMKFGGAVRDGESYEQCAKRELEEESGIKNAKLEFLFASKFRNKQMNANRQVFKCVYNKELTLQVEEVSWGKFVEIDEINSFNLSPSAKEVFEQFKEHNK